MSKGKENNKLIQRLLHTYSLPKANTLFPERGRSEGVTELGFKGKTDEGTCETFPRVFPFDEDSTVSRIEIHKMKIKYILK